MHKEYGGGVYLAARDNCNSLVALFKLHKQFCSWEYNDLFVSLMGWTTPCREKKVFSKPPPQKMLLIKQHV